MFEELLCKYGEEFDWWIPDNMSELEAQLAKELTPAHYLYNKKMKAVAKASATDDVLFTNGNHYFIVHLTWATGDKDYPKFTEAASLQEALDRIEESYLH